jgi:predicted permease
MRRLFGLPWRSERAIREELEEELHFHLEARAEDLVAEGMAPEEARAQALREFGDIEDARRYIRSLDRSAEAEKRRRDVMGDLRQDLVYAVRKLRSSPAFTATAIVTLALGIGANTAIFSVVNSVLFRPLPYPQPGQLYRVWSASPSSDRTKVAVSSPDLADWRAQRQRVEDIGGYWFADGGSGLDLTGQGEPQRLSAAFVTPGFFPTFAVAAARGRLPREDEMVRGGHDKVVVLSWGFWQRQFGGDPSIVGSSLTLSGDPYDVLGVMPAGFRYPSERVDIFVPYSSIPDHSIPHIRSVRVLDAVARARPGVGEEAVRTELNTITARMAEQYPEDDAYAAATVEPLRDAITGPARAGLLVLLGAVAFVLLIACVNVAGLLLARATTRSREIATRMALGADRGRIVRQLLTESLVLAAAGGLAGLGVARLLVGVFLHLAGGQLPRGSEVGIDGTVLLVAAGVSVLTGFLFGLAPALRTSSEGRGGLREGGRGSVGGEASRLRDVLVVAEVALAVVLVVGAGLMTRSFVELLHVDPGFRPDHLLAANFTISTERQGEDYGAFYESVIDKVRSLPGVMSAGAVKDAPFRGMGERWGFTPPGMVIPPGEEGPTAMALHVSDGYFHTIGATVLEGREFTPQDRADAPLVLMVNQALEKRYFPGEKAVGKTLSVGGNNQVPIVGVVADIRQSAMDEPAQPTIYVDNLQNARVKVTLVARTAGDPLALAGPLRQAIWSIDPDQTITSIFTFDDIVSEAVARPRLLTVLLGSFGVLGLILGALGIYGVLAYLVGHRQREIGVRLALGAHPGAVERMVVGRGLLLSSVGVALGLVGAFGLTRYIQGVLFGVAPTDPVTFVGVAVVLVATAALASWAPARRAAAVDPVAALRVE